MDMNQTVSFFRELTGPDINEIKTIASQKLCSKDELVFSEGDDANSFYIIDKGQVSIFYDNNGEDKQLCVLNENDYFGEMALFEDIPRSATIRTQKETRLLMLHKREFAEIVREYPQIALHICRVLGARLRKLHDKIKRNER